MSINFNTLPTEKPAIGNVIPKGHYVAKIRKAEMKTPKDDTKPDYFSAECDVTDPASGTAMGKFWINLYESEAALVRYQLSRFIQALRLPIQGEFDLKDLTKMVNGKELEVDIMPEERKDGKDPQRSVVDISNECFYPVGAYQSTDDAIAAVFSGNEAEASQEQAAVREMAAYQANTTPAVQASY